MVLLKNVIPSLIVGLWKNPKSSSFVACTNINGSVMSSFSLIIEIAKIFIVNSGVRIYYTREFHFRGYDLLFFPLFR